MTKKECFEHRIASLLDIYYQIFVQMITIKEMHWKNLDQYVEIIWNFLNMNLMNSKYLSFRPDDYTLETFLSEFLKRKWWISSTNKCISVVWLKLKETQSWLAKSTLIRTLLFLNLGMYKVIWISSHLLYCKLKYK